MTDFYKALDNFKEEYETRVRKLAMEYRNTVLLPLCKKYNLCFTSGMGTFFFCPVEDKDETWAPIESDFLDDEELLQMEVLDHEVSRDQYFGYYVDDIGPEDLQ